MSTVTTEPLPRDDSSLRALLESLRAAAASAQTEEEVRVLTSRIASITRQYRIQHGIGIPMRPDLQALDLDSAFVARPHLKFLGGRIANAVRNVERGHNQHVCISMPPRSGKTTLTSIHSPLWMLRRHPEWKVVLSSHDGDLTASWAKQIRTTIEDRPDLGVALSPDGGAGSKWQTVERGGMFATSTRASLTGRGARVLIIDDPVKDFVEAHSLAMRQNLWDWWLSVALTRLEPPYLVLVVMCMTGDTPVLRPDGTQTPLSQIRPGDEIATYENGSLSISTVKNWANQGQDNIYSISMASGRTVRANARHPFLVVDESGDESWVRLGSLQVGMKVRSVEGLMPGSSALKTDAAARPSARACVCRTTPEPVTQQGIGRLHPVTRSAARSGSRGVMGSPLTAMPDFSLSRTNVVPFVESELTRSTDQSIGLRSSVSTMTMTPESCEVCSATTATSSSDAGTRQVSCEQPLLTWSVGTDEIVEIVESGREDVFDIEVDRTHNFIANGLTVSNTRWHEDDFIGRLLSSEYEGDPRQWEKISLPAIAESDDILKRAEGEPLMSPILTESRGQALDRWEDVRRSVGTYTFSAMYQQRPAPAKGAIFDSGWWRFWTMNPDLATDDGRVVYLDPSSLTGGTWLDSWDCAFKSTHPDTGGWVVGQRWVRQAANRYLISQQRGRWSFTQTISAMKQWAITNDPARSRCGHLVHKRIIEEAANGAAVIDTLKNDISGLSPITASIGKVARARIVTPEIESGNVFLPHPSDPGNEWVTDLLSELRNFPNDTADDQVDALTQGLLGLRDGGKGGISNPNRMMQGRPQWQQPRDLARAAASDMNRFRSGGGRGPTLPGRR